MSWCPDCGDEFQDEITRCPDCDVSLTATAPVPVTETKPGREVVYELELTKTDRRALELLLTGRHITFSWDDRDRLVIPKRHETAVDRALEWIAARADAGDEENPELEPPESRTMRTLSQRVRKYLSEHPYP